MAEQICGAVPATSHTPNSLQEHRPALCTEYRARLEALYRCEARALRAYLARHAGHEAADDLAQEVFLRAALCPQLRELHNPGGFLHRIARNLVIDRARRRRAGKVTIAFPDATETARAPDQEERLEARDTREVYERAIASLPPRTARIFVMSRREQKTYRQISEELLISPATVEYHMMNALRRIRASLAEAHGEPGVPDQI